MHLIQTSSLTQKKWRFFLTILKTILFSFFIFLFNSKSIPHHLTFSFPRTLFTRDQLASIPTDLHQDHLPPPLPPQHPPLNYSQPSPPHSPNPPLVNHKLSFSPTSSPLVWDLEQQSQQRNPSPQPKRKRISSLLTGAQVSKNKC